MFIMAILFQRCQSNDTLHPTIDQLFQRVSRKSILVFESRIIFPCDIQQGCFPGLRKPQIVKRTGLSWREPICQRIDFIVHIECPFGMLYKMERIVFRQFLHFLFGSSTHLNICPIQKDNRNHLVYHHVHGMLRQ